MGTDETLFKLVKEKLFSAVIGDILDKHRRWHQFLPPTVRPLKPYGVVVGRALPVLEADAYDDSQPFGRMFEALDDLQPGEIYLAAGGSPRYALFGELMATAATQRGAHGDVVCGYHRDTLGLSEVDPVFSYGPYAQDQGVRGRVIDYRVPIEIEGVYIEPGDLIVADIDGIVAVPRHLEGVVIEEALDKVSTESEVRKALQRGMKAQLAFDTFGVM